MKFTDGESFESHKRRFDLTINRFANWDPPIQLSEPLLLFFVFRGLPASPHGPVIHIVLASDHIGLTKDLRLLHVMSAKVKWN